MKSYASNAIADAMFADINGQPQWITIRGRDRRNPVLFIVGGPGAAFSTWAQYFLPWEESFTLVQWDQPGAGATWGKHAEAGLIPYTLDRLTHDAIAVAEFIRNHLVINKVVCFGMSGGTVIGLMAVYQRPELFQAYVGCGQFVHWQRQARLSYEIVLQQARDQKNHKAVTELESIGPPPYPGIEAEVSKAKYAGDLHPGRNG